MKAYFVDEKERKAAPAWSYIATPGRLQYIEDVLNKHAQDIENADTLRRAIKVLRSTPLMSSEAVMTCYRMISDTQYTTQNVHALVTAANFNTALQSSQLNADLPFLNAALDQGPTVIAAMKELNKWGGECYSNDKPLFTLAGASRHKVIQKGLTNGNIRIEQFVPRNDFASTESFALFSCIKTPQGLLEGYLNTPGNLVPLSQAKLYESLASAESAMARSGSVAQYGEVQIVRLNIAVAGMEHISKSHRTDCLVAHLEESCIQTVASDVQKSAIEAALQQATDEQLRHQYEERKSPSVKRKM